MSTKEEMQAAAGLHKKLAAVMAAVTNVDKRGYNEAQKYGYAKAEDILREVRPLLAEHGLSFFPAVLKAEHSRVETGAGRWQNVTTLTLEYTLTDTESGYQEKIPWTGVGQDSGDKALYKAYTGAIKYFWLETLLIPTGDDPEEEETPGPKGRPATRSVAAPRPAPRPATPGQATVATGGVNLVSRAVADSAAALGLVEPKEADLRHAKDAFWGVDKKTGEYRSRAQWEAWLRQQKQGFKDEQIAAMSDEVLKRVVKEGFAKKEVAS